MDRRQSGRRRFSTVNCQLSIGASGVSQVEFLVVLLMFCLAMAIGWPYLMRSNNSSAEGKAVNTLKQIHLAQQDYYGGRRMYGDEKQLRDFGVLTAETQQSDAKRAVGLEAQLTYSIYISVSGARTKWCAAAIPSPKGRTIAIDESGKVMFDRTCYDGTVQ